jgi:hypothetical protein
MTTNDNECPICFVIIENNNNITVTECGHKYHSKCLIDMMSHGCFNCPMCRFTLGEIKEEIVTEYEDSDLDSDISEEEIELYTDHSLRGLRLFTNNLFGISHTITDLEEEKSYYKFDNDDNLCNDDEPFSDYSLLGLRLFTNNLTGVKHDNEDIENEKEDTMPSEKKIVENLLKNKVTYEDLVNCILYRCFDKYIEIQEPLRRGKKVIRDINILIAEHKNL